MNRKELRNEILLFGFMVSEPDTNSVTFWAIFKRGITPLMGRELRNECDELQPTVLRELRRMEKNGLVTERLDRGGVGKGRNYPKAYWSLTKKGREEQEKLFVNATRKKWGGLPPNLLR